MANICGYEMINEKNDAERAQKMAAQYMRMQEHIRDIEALSRAPAPSRIDEALCVWGVARRQQSKVLYEETYAILIRALWRTKDLEKQLFIFDLMNKHKEETLHFYAF